MKPAFVVFAPPHNFSNECIAIVFTPCRKRGDKTQWLRAEAVLLNGKRRGTDQEDFFNVFGREIYYFDAHVGTHRRKFFYWLSGDFPNSEMWWIGNACDINAGRL